MSDAKESLERMRRTLDNIGPPAWDVSAKPRTKKRARFDPLLDLTDPFLKTWWESDVRGWDDPEHFFLDKSYSTPMPAVDCTPFVARAIATREIDALVELWYWLGGGGYLTRPAEAAECSFGRFRNLDPVSGVTFAEEGLAVHELMIRSHFSGHFPINQYMELALVTVGLRWPSDEGGETVSGEWTDKLKQLPPVARLMIMQSFFREGDSWLGVRAGGRVSLRPEMCYGERSYGNNTDRNLQYADWLDCWKDVIPLDAVPRRSVTKAVIIDKAASMGVELKAAWKRDRMLDVCRGNAELWKALWKGNTDRFYCEDALEEFRTLAFFLKSMEPVVREFMETLGLGQVISFGQSD